MKIRVLLVALALVLVAVPAVADHVTEPQWPITRLVVDVYEYPDRLGTLLSACDGSEKVTFSNLRVEPLISYVQDGNGSPSEHWRVRIEVLPGRMVNGVFRHEKSRGGAGTIWTHQNVPPHRGTRAFESAEWTTYLHAVGYWEVFVEVIGDESGTVLTETCLFEKIG